MADINILPAQALVRQPRGAVKLNGEVITGWDSWEVDNNAYRSADTFRVVFVVSKLPSTRGADWFAAQTSVRVEIFGNPNPATPDNYQPKAADSLILGQVDDISYNPAAGTIEVSGRDLTALLIDTKTSAHYKDKRSSEIATLLAQAHGLTPVVTGTSTRVGKYYEQDRVTLTQEQSEWDLLTYLATFEDYLLFVDGDELHFEPRPEPSGYQYALTWEPPTAGRAYAASNAVDLRFSRNLTISKGIAVEVRSWNVKTANKPIVATFPKSPKGAAPGSSGARTQLYKRFYPHLTHEQAEKRAESIYRQLIAHEMHLTAYLPADSLVTCTTLIQVRGTGTAFDQLYYPESVQRSMSVSEGYRMNIRAKNTGPDLEALT